MSDAAPAVKTPKKRVPKPKKPASHPKYSEMIAKAVNALKERGGSSRQAILKYIIANYSVGTNVNAVNARLKSALKAGVKSGSLKQAKGTGAAGSFRLGEKKAPVAKKVKKPKAAGEKKPKAKKPKAKKTGEKKAAKPKKAKSPKAKTAAKPKKPKSPKKPKAAKPKAAKKAKSPKKK